jgi:hypothetical protein
VNQIIRDIHLAVDIIIIDHINALKNDSNQLCDKYDVITITP